MPFETYEIHWTPVGSNNRKKDERRYEKLSSSKYSLKNFSNKTFFSIFESARETRIATQYGIENYYEISNFPASRSIAVYGFRNFNANKNNKKKKRDY